MVSSFQSFNSFAQIFKALSNFAGDSKEYPLLPPNDSCPTSPRSRSPQSIRSNSQLSDYSNGHPERLMSPEDDDDHSDEESEESERSLSTPPHPGAPHPLEQSPHAVYLRPSPFEQCNSKSPPNHQHMPPAQVIRGAVRWPRAAHPRPDSHQLGGRSSISRFMPRVSPVLIINVIKLKMTNEKGCDQRRGMECQRRHHPLLYLFVERRILHVDVTTIHAEEIHPKNENLLIYRINSCASPDLQPRMYNSVY